MKYIFNVENSGNATQGLQTPLPDESVWNLAAQKSAVFSENDRDDSVRLLRSRDDST